MIKLFKRIHDYFTKPLGLCKNCNEPIAKCHYNPYLHTVDGDKSYECPNCHSDNWIWQMNEYTDRKDCNLHMQRVNKRG